MRRSKIIATLGPASNSSRQIESLIRAGADLFRLNFSHGTPEEHGRTVARVRKAAGTMKRAVGIIGDIPGPKVRVGHIPDGGVLLKKGSTVYLRRAKSSKKKDVIPVPHDIRELEPGERVLLRDGLIVLEVKKRRPHGSEDATKRASSGGRIACRVIDGGWLSTAGGISAPHIGLGVSAVTKKDREKIKLAVGLDLDWLGVSFVGSPKDIAAARTAAERAGKTIPVVAKIERAEAVDGLDAILEAADAVMVARGDLALEVPLERVPLLQKDIIAKARRFGIPSIVATQMLESMVDESRPTRAEATDVANAILDGASATMLSEETAVGNWPVAAVRTMAAIAGEAEESGRPCAEYPRWGSGVLVAVARAVQAAACSLDASAILVFTLSGATARAISAMRPQLPVFALTPEQTTYRRMSLYWGVEPVLIPRARSTDHMLRVGEEALIGGGHLKKGAEVIAVSGSSKVGGASNMIRIGRLGE